VLVKFFNAKQLQTALTNKHVRVFLPSLVCLSVQVDRDLFNGRQIAAQREHCLGHGSTKIILFHFRRGSVQP